jgi:endonuclease III related protein
MESRKDVRKTLRISPDRTGQRLDDMFHLLLEHFGPQDWWPAETEVEVIVGAILTQNTNWSNVEKAIANLKRSGLLDIACLNSISVEALAQEIRPAGYYNIKAKRLKNLIDFIQERYGGDMESLLGEDTAVLRQGLLSVKGIGPETADSILLYAAGRPVFVVDAYTHRILSRHALMGSSATYDELQGYFQDHLPEDQALFNDFHALIVKTGKHYCRKRPLCPQCPLENWGPSPPSVEM